MSRAEVRGLTKTFGDVVALDDVSLAVEAGEFLAIVGSSGCGKTTLLRQIAGFDRPSAGTVHLDGHEVGSPHAATPPERRDIGMVFQTFALWPHLTVVDQIRFPLEHRRGLAPDLVAGREERIDEVLALTGLSDLRHRYPGELSGGQQQRVGLARAIAPRPSVLLMDEPLSALDAELREELRREIQTLHRLTGVSILYVTHDQSEALSMADRVAVMRHGRIEQLGTPHEIYHRPSSAFVARFVGRANLVPGTWDGEVFLPAGGGGARWDGTGVAASFRTDGVLPLRPEQLSIVAADTGEHGAPPGGALPGTIVNALFNGREMHYTVDLAHGPVQIATSTAVQHPVGTPVHVTVADALRR